MELTRQARGKRIFKGLILPFVIFAIYATWRGDLPEWLYLEHLFLLVLSDWDYGLISEPLYWLFSFIYPVRIYLVYLYLRGLYYLTNSRRPKTEPK